MEKWKMLKKLSFWVCVFLIIGIVRWGTIDAQAASLNKKSVTLVQGQTTKLKIKGAKNKVKWTTNKKMLQRFPKKAW